MFIYIIIKIIIISTVADNRVRHTNINEYTWTGKHELACLLACFYLLLMYHFHEDRSQRFVSSN